MSLINKRNNIGLNTDPDSHQNLSCLRSGVHYSRFIGKDTAEELLTPLLGQLNFWCENGIP